MLVFTRRVKEVVRIADDISIKILGVKGNQVRLGINAPKNIPVHREEVYWRIHSEQQKTRGFSVCRDNKNTDNNKITLS